MKGFIIKITNIKNYHKTILRGKYDK